MNGVTFYTNIVDGSGQAIKTNTYPDGGTRIETYFRDGALASIIGTAVQPVRYVYDVELDGTTNRPYTKEIKLNASFADTTEWVKSYSDLAGRNYKTVHAAASGTPSTQSYYNDKGQLWKQMDPDSVITLYKYNPKGEQEYAVQALTSTARNLTTYASLEASWNSILGGADRITQTANTVLANGASGNSRGVDLRRTERYVWKNGSGTGSLVSRNDVATTGNQTWSSAWKDASTEVTTTSVTAIDAPNHTRTLTASAPDGSQSVTVYLNGRLLSVTRKDNTANHNQVTQTTYAYDPQGRQSTAADARNGTTTYGYNDADLVTSVTTPAPGGLGQAPQTTLTHYNKSLQVTNVVQPDNTSVTNEYFLTGLLKKTYGSRTYPVEYTYDYAGRMKTMKTWQNFASGIGAATTTWNYNQYRGWLDSKDYANASTGNPGTTGPDYTYTPGGRLKTRTWARTGTGGQCIVTTYKYGFDDTPTGNEHGDLTEVSYQNDPQSTPTVTHTYDRLGRQSTIVQGGMTTTKTYNDASEQLTEAYTGGTLAGLTVTSGYDNYLRRSSLSLNTQPSSLNFSYAYDTASRLETVTDATGSPTYSATYAYLANSPLVSTVTLKQGTDLRMTTTKQYDFLNRLTAIATVGTGSTPSPMSYGYTYNDANQRTRATLGDLSYWVYGYDSLGQVKSGKRYWFNGTPVAGQQFEYGFDDIGNRTQTKAGGDQNGASLRTNTYTANKLNQYTSRTVPGAVDVMGAALVSKTVTVNGPTPAAYRKGEYFRKQLTVANGSAPVWHSVSVAATGETIVTGNVFVPRTPEQYDDPATPSVNEGYDLDGNQLRDGRWNYAWDAENRLKQVESLASGPTASKRKVVWEFDAQGRRIRQTTYDGSSGSYAVTEDLKLVYDGWACVAELNYADNALKRSYVSGTDLSGSLGGAGGVGGLLMVNSVANGAHFCAYDGNGNVAALVKATDATVSANYEYGPFGEPVRATGTLAKENPFRFSTKRTDNTTDLVLYEYRLYNPNTGRWLSRDPIEEQGFDWLQGGTYDGAAGPNLYNFVANNPLSGIDLFGLRLGDGEVPGEHGYPPYPPNPSMIGKKCCGMSHCPAHLTGIRTDTAPTSDSIFGIYTRWTLHLGVDVHTDSDCYTDVRVDWMRCWGPGGAGYMGSGTSLNLSVSTWLGIGTVYLTQARINYLTCENGVWAKKLSKAGMSYRWTGTGWEFTIAGSGPTTTPPGS